MDGYTLVNACVIVEVLSDSTEAYDRGVKFAHHPSIATLEEYVLVASRARRVEHFRRQGDGHRWLLTVYTGESEEIGFPSLDGAVAMRDVYDKWETLSA